MARGGTAAADASGKPAPSLESMRAGLIAPEGRAFSAPTWLKDAASDPKGFWRSVAPVLMSAPAGSARSSLFERYNLFHELGARHADRGRLGFAELDDAGGFIDCSYASLVERASCLARAWREHGVEPGSALAIVHPMSSDFVVAILAAWRCGAAVTPLPAFGRTYLRNRLAALKANFVAATKGRALWLGVPEKSALPLTAPDGMRTDRETAHLFAPGDLAARFFSPLGTDPFALADVTAEHLYLCALRDGALLLSLDPGESVAAPGFCEVQYKPPLLFAALSMGARFVEAKLSTARAHPEELLNPRVQLLGVTDEMRDLYMHTPRQGRGTLLRWFRNPAADPAYESWDRFAALPICAPARGLNYFPNGAACGAIVAAAWRRNPGRNAVVSAPGWPWRLTSASLRAVDALGPSGVLAAGDDKKPDIPQYALGRPILVRTGDESLWISSLDAHRLGQRLPGDEMCTTVCKAHRDVWGAALVDYPRGDGTLGAGAALVVFVRPTAEASVAAGLAKTVDETIRIELGDAFTPDRIDVFPLAPRFDEGDLTRLHPAWARDQYVGGLLALKKREPLFVALGGLRHALFEARPNA